MKSVFNTIVFTFIECTPGYYYWFWIIRFYCSINNNWYRIKLVSNFSFLRSSLPCWCVITPLIMIVELPYLFEKNRLNSEPINSIYSCYFVTFDFACMRLLISIIIDRSIVELHYNWFHFIDPIVVIQLKKCFPCVCCNVYHREGNRLSLNDHQTFEPTPKSTCCDAVTLITLMWFF